MNPDLIRKTLEQELARRVFWHFCMYVDGEFFSKRAFLKPVAEAFQRIAEGDLHSLSVSMPPRAGKSYITSLYCAWLIGKKPEGSVMRNSCTTTLYNKFSYDVRGIVKDTPFKEVFPDVDLADDKQAVAGWNTNKAKQVSYFGSGVGGTIIGFGANSVAISDDLYRNLEDALSEQVNEKVESWYYGTHNSRFEKGCPRIDIGTRWSKKDILGKNIEQGNYDESIIVPALIDGESFCDDVKTTEEYNKIKEITPDEIWNAEYMQEPIESKGTVFDSNELEYFTELPPGEPDAVLGYIDVADVGDDYLAFCLGKVYGQKVYITDVIYTKEPVEVSEPLCVGLIEEAKPQFVRIEANNQGRLFARNIEKQVTGTQILKVNNSTNKHTRILMVSAFVKKYFVFMDKNVIPLQYQMFMKSLTQYTKMGKQKNDDAPDSIAGLGKFINTYLAHNY